MQGPLKQGDSPDCTAKSHTNNKQTIFDDCTNDPVAEETGIISNPALTLTCPNAL